VSQRILCGGRRRCRYTQGLTSAHGELASDEAEGQDYMHLCVVGDGMVQELCVLEGIPRKDDSVLVVHYSDQ
jgi:hypothetical protein